jgi:hypothetical protein
MKLSCAILFSILMAAAQWASPAWGALPDDTVAQIELTCGGCEQTACECVIICCFRNASPPREPLATFSGATLKLDSKERSSLPAPILNNVPVISPADVAEVSFLPSAIPLYQRVCILLI